MEECTVLDVQQPMTYNSRQTAKILLPNHTRPLLNTMCYRNLCLCDLMYCYMSGLWLNDLKEWRPMLIEKAILYGKIWAKEECVFPDGGCWVQDNIEYVKWTHLTNKTVLSGSHKRIHTFAKTSKSMIHHLTRYVTLMVLVACGTVSLKRPSQVAIKKSKLILS